MQWSCDYDVEQNEWKLKNEVKIPDLTIAYTMLVVTYAVLLSWLITYKKNSTEKR